MTKPAMTILDKIKFFRQVWRILLPHLTEPAAQDAARWGIYPPEAVEAALLRTAKRFARNRVPESFDPQQAYRYVTATARSIAQRMSVRATT